MISIWQCVNELEVLTENLFMCFEGLVDQQSQMLDDHNCDKDVAREKQSMNLIVSILRNASTRRFEQLRSFSEDLLSEHLRSVGSSSPNNQLAFMNP